MPIEIKLICCEDDLEAVRELCREFVYWQLEEFPHLREKILAYFEPSKWEAELADLPRIHARPKGAMQLALHDGVAAGCIMYHEMEPGIAEVKRLFVRPCARGEGIGRALVAEMLTMAADDGYTLARLDTARVLTAAIELYKKAGFSKCEPFGNVPPEAADLAVFMERPLPSRPA